MNARIVPMTCLLSMLVASLLTGCSIDGVGNPRWIHVDGAAPGEPCEIDTDCEWQGACFDWPSCQDGVCAVPVPVKSQRICPNGVCSTVGDGACVPCESDATCAAASAGTDPCWSWSCGETGACIPRAVDGIPGC